MIFAAVAALHALPALTEFVITGGQNGAAIGTFDGGGSGLVNISDLSNTSASDRQYVLNISNRRSPVPIHLAFRKVTRTRC